MADVNINKFRASVVRDGSKPASPGFIVSEGQDPVDPAGNGQNHLPVTIATAATGLSITDSQVLGGAGNVGQYIRGDGSLADFPQASGGGSSVSYYLNGSISQGTIGGVAYKELNKVPILGAGTDFTINADGYIASFLTDAGDPNLLEIPGGNWNFETYFSASSSGGSPSFYVELYKYDGTTFTLIASSSSSPELIAFGTNLNPYFSTLAVPTTTLALTDRLAIRYYVTHSGRTITLHTENNHLCQVVTTFTTGLTSLNGLTAQVQNLAVGTSGTDFNIASATATHTFNLPTASATNRGALSSADWTTFNNKQNALGYVPVPETRTITINGVSQDLSANRTYNVGTVTSVGLSSATSGVTIGGSPVTGVGAFTLAIATASGSQNGLLSSTDWTTFNNKQNALTNPVTGTGTTNYLPKFTGSTTIGNSQIFDNGTLVGIGTANPEGKLTIEGTSAQPPTSGTTANSLLQLKGSLGNELNLGSNTVAGNYGAYIQSSDNNLAVPYQLNLQPTGGNVIIGSYTDNGARLQVSGTSTFTGNLKINLNIAASAIDLINTSTNNIFTTYGNASNNTYIGLVNNNGVVQTNNDFEVFTGSSYTRRLIVNSSGNVGIGTASPVYKIHVVGENFNQAILDNTGQQYTGLDFRNNGTTKTDFYYDNTNTAFNIRTRVAGPLILSTTDTERMRITSGGNVLIGTTTDTGYKLRVNGSVLAGNHVVTSGSTAPALNATGTLASGVSYAIIAIYETTNTGKGCILLMAAGVLTLVSNPSGDYTTTVNTANKWNVTVSSGVISIQNNRASGDAFNATINRLD